jgi:hypothetical protein
MIFLMPASSCADNSTPADSRFGAIELLDLRFVAFDLLVDRFLL